jgi:hypothetical protein
LTYKFGSVKIDDGNAVKDTFKLLPELNHTFRPEVKDANPLIPNAFTLITLSPWLFLIAAVFFYRSLMIVVVL